MELYKHYSETQRVLYVDLLDRQIDRQTDTHIHTHTHTHTHTAIQTLKAIRIGLTSPASVVLIVE